MLTEWHKFLQSQGARIEDDDVLDFGAPGQEATAARSGNIIADLSYLAVLKVTGPDATAFLHGQFSSDIKHMTEGSVQLSTWCNPKGQVIINFIITRIQDEYILIFPEAMRDTFSKRLRMYVLRANVSIEDRSESLTCIGIKQAGEQRAATGILSNSTQDSTTILDDLITIPLLLNHNRKLVLGPDRSLQAAWVELSADFTPVGTHYWRMIDIFEGLPWTLPVTSETFLPQMLNMDQLQAISFKKGCFPGQEIIARLQHRGKVKQRLVIANLEDGTGIKPGMNIYQDDRENSIGTIINIEKQPANSLYALAVLDIDHDKPEHLHLKNEPARFFKITMPPYLNHY